MSGPLSDTDLELFFAAARAAEVKPSEEFLARVEQDALRFCPQKSKKSKFNLRTLWERLFSQKPGWVYPGMATGMCSALVAAFLVLQAPSSMSDGFEHDVLAMVQLETLLSEEDLVLDFIEEFEEA